MRTDERVCPFCGADVAEAMAQAPTRVLPRKRLGRAALMSFGIAAGAAALASCEDDEPEDTDYNVGTDYGGAPNEEGDRERDDKLDGGRDARVLDARAPVKKDASSADASSPEAGPRVAPVYGAPPQNDD